MTPRLRGIRSLELSLPAAVAGLLLLALAGFGYLAWRSVATLARDAAQSRLGGLAAEYASQLAREAQATAELAAARAALPAVRAAAGRGPAPSGAALDSALLGGLPAKLVAAELRDSAGRRLLVRGSDTTLADAALDPWPPQGGAGVGAFVASGGAVLLPAVAPVPEHGGSRAWLIHWWRLNASAAERSSTEQLMGPGTALLFGTAHGVWTDQVDTVPRPPIAIVPGTELLRYPRGARGLRLGMAAAVPGTRWLVLVEQAETTVLAPASAFLRRLVLAGAVLALLGILAGWLTMRRLTYPLGRLAGAAEAISAGDYGQRVRIARRDELGLVGAAFDTMADRIQDTHGRLEAKIAELHATQAQFAHVQRMEAVGRLAGGVAHDFNNLLSVILAECQLAIGALPRDHEVRESLEDIERAAERAAALTRQLLAFSRRQVMETSVFSINDMVTELERVLQRLVGETIRVTAHPEATQPQVAADRAQLEQVLLNLVINARDAMPRGGRIGIDTRNVTLDERYTDARGEVQPGEYVLLAVSDTGMGINEEEKLHLFEPFFTTKARGKGTGLGLATCFGIVKQHGGHIAAYSEVGVGSTFRVYLPVARQAPTAAAAAEGAIPRGTETVLLVEDELALRHVAGRILVRQGYTVLEAPSAEEALALLETRAEEVDILVSDVVLPGLGGRELAEAVTARWPAIKVLFVSGYTDDVILQHHLLAGGVHLLQKPYTMTSLSRAVRTVLDGD